MASFTALTSGIDIGSSHIPGVGTFVIGTAEMWLMTAVSFAGAVIFGLFGVGCIGVIAKWDFGLRLAVSTPQMIIGMVMLNVCYNVVLMIRMWSFIESSGRRLNTGMLGVSAICAMFALFLFLLIPILVGRWAEE